MRPIAGPDFFRFPDVSYCAWHFAWLFSVRAFDEQARKGIWAGRRWISYEGRVIYEFTNHQFLYRLKDPFNESDPPVSFHVIPQCQSKPRSTNARNACCAIMRPPALHCPQQQCGTEDDESQMHRTCAYPYTACIAEERDVLDKDVYQTQTPVSQPAIPINLI